MPIILIALGSNLGDRLNHLRRAVGKLQSLVTIEGISGVYETAPMYLEEQPFFLNAAVRGRSDLSPRQILMGLKQIESDIGRIPTTPNGPREIDLDLVGYGSLVYRFENEGRVVTLQVPHPRTPERRFVLQPLDDIATEFLLPGVGVIHQLLKQTDSQSGCVKRSDYALFPI